MRLSQIRDFVAVARLGSIRAAARSVGVSQPAMTKSLQQLERELRTQLLQRTSRGAIPTYSGKAFLARARVIQSELRRVEEDIAQIRGEPGGTVALGVSPTASILLVPEMLRRLQRHQPVCSVRVVEGAWSTLQPLVRDETLDLAVVVRTPDADIDPAMRFKPLYRAHLVIAGRRGHPLASARSLRELGSASWLMFGPRGQTALLAQYFATAGLTAPPVTVQCESYAAALGLLTRTDTLGLILPELLPELCTHGSLAQIRVEEPTPAVTVGVLTRGGAPLTPVALAMARAAGAAARTLRSQTAERAGSKARA
jgi:LysR family transcriptional regulator, regulator of abg operon